jgi:hypothetical protein
MHWINRTFVRLLPKLQNKAESFGNAALEQKTKIERPGV